MTLAVVACLGCTLASAAPRPGNDVGPGALPSRPIEFVVSTEPGGASDIYARYIKSVIDRRQLAPQPVLPVNKPGRSGADALRYVHDRPGDMHIVTITLNSFFTTLIEQQGTLAFGYTDFTPIANLALDPFFLWVAEDSPWRTAQDVVAAARTSELVVGGTGSRQEDEILFHLIEERANTRPVNYVSYSGGGAVATALASHQLQATVNNPSEGLALHQTSPRRIRPLCSFASTSPAAGPYQGLPTCREQGLDVGIDYAVLRAVVGPPGLSAEQVQFHADVMREVFASREWQEFAQRNVLELRFLEGAELQALLDDYYRLHQEVMRRAGWTA